MIDDRLREAIRERVFAGVGTPESAALARAVVEAGGPSVAAIVFFGSRKTRAKPDEFSAYDLFVVLHSYGDFYGSLGRAGKILRPRISRVLNSVLPPNQLSLSTAGPDGATLRAKCAVVRFDTLERATSGRRKDHFVAGRFFQPTQVLYTASPADGERLLDSLTSAHRITFGWVRPWLPPTFDVEEYCRTSLRVSFAGEIRPEPEGRTHALWLAQEDYLRPIYSRLLEELAAGGHLSAVSPGRYSVTHHPHDGERLRRHLYFFWSLVRATLRWAKYVITFDEWLEFIVRKARRHTGQDIVLTPRERSMPLVFLWPRVFRFLRHKDDK